MHAELIVLRIIHILAGIFWVGTGLFSTFFLGPALMKAGPAAASQVMGALQQRKMFTWMPVMALLTILSGARLMMIVSGGDPHWFQHRSGHAYSVSALLAIIALLVGLVVSRPAIVKAGKLTHAAASDETSKKLIAEEVRKLQRRSYISSTLAVSLLTLSAIGMAIARYL